MVGVLVFPTRGNNWLIVTVDGMNLVKLIKLGYSKRWKIEDCCIMHWGREIFSVSSFN